MVWVGSNPEGIATQHLFQNSNYSVIVFMISSCRVNSWYSLLAYNITLLESLPHVWYLFHSDTTVAFQWDPYKIVINNIFREVCTLYIKYVHCMYDCTWSMYTVHCTVYPLPSKSVRGLDDYTLYKVVPITMLNWKNLKGRVELWNLPYGWSVSNTIRLVNALFV